MVGIYLITNICNNKKYIGQSKHIERRWAEHKRTYKYDDNRLHLYSAMKKYGINNFEFKVIEECLCEDLDNKEMYYIQLYNTLVPNGYNIKAGGNDTVYFIGEDNPNSKMTDEFIFQIRERYANGERKSNVYENYTDIISINTFADIWIGKTWTHIHMDVYTEENKEKHKHGSSSEFHCSVLSRDDVRFIRDCKNNGLLKQDVMSEFFPNINYNTFCDAWYGATFTDIISNAPKIEIDKNVIYYSRSGCGNHNSSLDKDTVIEIRKRRDSGETIRNVHKDFPEIKRHTFSNVWYDRSYKNIEY